MKEDTIRVKDSGNPPSSSYLLELKDQILLSREPFSDRGSRLLLFQEKDGSGLSLRIARRFSRLDSALDQHRKRPAYLQQITFRDDQGQPLDYQLTTYPHLLQFNTRIGPFQIVFQNEDTIAVGLPAGQKCGLSFDVHTPLIVQNGISGEIKEVRSLAYISTCPLSSQRFDSVNRKQQVTLSAEAGEQDAILIQIRSCGQHHLQPETFSQIKNKAEQKWHSWFASVPEICGKFRTRYYFAWWVLANNLVHPGGMLKHEALMPSKAKYIGIWNWDSCFHALGLRYHDIQLARNQLRMILQHQQPDGMLPDAVYDECVVTWIDHPIPGAVTKPPLLAWTALKLHDNDPDLAFLKEIYTGLCRWNEWWFSHQDHSGLPHYTHPYSSGLDDHPLWDHEFPITSPDLITYLIIQMRSLAEISRLLGKEEQETRWRDQVVSLTTQLIEELYDPENGYFLARNAVSNIPEYTPFNLLPLWTEIPDSDIVHTLLSHLDHGGPFWNKHPLSTVSAGSPNYDSETMWRGPVWINLNYLMIEALESSYKSQLASQLREATLDLVNGTEGIFEYYNPETGDPPPEAAPAFSWSAALFIDLVLQAQKQASGSTLAKEEL